MSMRRSAGRPIITPIMSCPTGRRAWSSRPPSASTSSTAGAAAGAGRRPSSTAMRAPSRRSPGAAASASRSAPSCRWRRALATPPRRRPPPRRSAAGQRRQLPARGAAPLRAAARDTANAMIAERTRADRTLTTSQRWALTGSDTGPAAQAPLGRRAEGAEPPRELQGVRYRWDPAPPARRRPDRRRLRRRRHAERRTSQPSGTR